MEQRYTRVCVCSNKIIISTLDLFIHIRHHEAVKLKVSHINWMVQFDGLPFKLIRQNHIVLSIADIIKNYTHNLQLIKLSNAAAFCIHSIFAPFFGHWLSGHGFLVNLLLFIQFNSQNTLKLRSDFGYFLVLMWCVMPLKKNTTIISDEHFNK